MVVEFLSSCIGGGRGGPRGGGSSGGPYFFKFLSFNISACQFVPMTIEDVLTIFK